MFNTSRVAAALLAVSWVSVGAQSAPTRVEKKDKKPTIAQFLAPAMPMELVSAGKADRIAWLSYDQGVRNVFTAAPPEFKPVQITKYTGDDGVTLTDLQISDDGSTVAFVRGSEPNREGWIADPSSNPGGGERAVWAAMADGSGAWRLVVTTTPSALSPDGHSVIFAKDGQIYRVKVSASRPVAAMDRGEEPFIKLWGRNGAPRWSPDGSKIAFVTERPNHSYVVVYDMKTRTVRYVAPGVDFDSSPIWSPDGKRIIFVRRPGTPFGQQTQAGVGGIGGPAGPAGARAGTPPAGRGGGRGRGDQTETGVRGDGLTRATFEGGYSSALMMATVATGEASELWHPAAGQQMPPLNAARWAGENLIFGREDGEWTRVFAAALSNPGAPFVLTPGEGMVETTGLSADRKTLYYGSNVGDIDRRHVWKVPTTGGSPVQVTTGDEIEMSPAPLATGKLVAVLTSSGTRPMSVGIVPVSGGPKKIIFPTFAKDFPFAASVNSQNVLLKAADGVQFHNQLFLPADIKPGERRPAMVFVHGGPPRQMLLGYHYMDFYHTAYAVNQWLQSQGYVVLSVNYRLGIGYGRTFQQAGNEGGGAGNAEYRDVLAAGQYLQSRSDVDPNRVGIWGLSYGGVLTAQALARNSDIFAAGFDMAGVHLWGSSLDTASVSYKSSSISAIDKWKSPVLIWHGDDDRNVDFSQSIGLIQLLRAHGIPHELIVFPDDTHETLIHARWLYTFDRMQDFFQRRLWNRKAAATQ